MKLVTQVKLLPNEEQTSALRRTLLRANALCDWLSAKAWESKEFRKFDLQKLTYHEARQVFPDIGANTLIRCIAKVADSYKVDKLIQREFRPSGSISYNYQLLTWKSSNTVSIWTVDGRIHVPYTGSQEALQMLDFPRGEVDLVLKRGKFYLNVSIDVPDVLPSPPKGWLGVDMGIVNLAVDSDGDIFSGTKTEEVRQRYQGHRQRLQTTGTKSAKRRLKKISGKEARFKSIENHRISKAIVSKAKGTARGIALEILEGITKRVTVRKSQRAKLSSWAFHQLKTYITYKASLAGVEVQLVLAHFTSQICPSCGVIDKKNRRSQAEFQCRHCDYKNHADIVGAINVSLRAAVNQPSVGVVDRVASTGDYLQHLSF